MTTPREKIDRLLAQLVADRQQRHELQARQEDGMRCDECSEHAELICLDCEVPFCPEHLHSLGAHWANVVCAGCMDVEMAGAS